MVDEPAMADRSVGELFSQLTADLGVLVRDEITLAKLELKSDAQQIAKSGGMFGAAAFAGYMSIVLLSFAAAWGLAAVMPAGWAFLIVAAVWAVGAAILYLRGRNTLRATSLKPEQTVETLKENVTWAKNLKS